MYREADSRLDESLKKRERRREWRKRQKKEKKNTVAWTRRGVM